MYYLNSFNLKILSCHTTQWTLVKYGEPWVGLEPERVLHPIDDGRRVPASLADEDGIPAGLHDLHGGRSEDPWKAGGQVTLWKGKQNKFCQVPSLDHILTNNKVQCSPSMTWSCALADTSSPTPFSATHSKAESSRFFLAGSMRSKDPPGNSVIRYLRQKKREM